MKFMTKITTLLIALFLVSCITDSNQNDDFDNRLKVYNEIYNDLNAVFGKDPIIVGVITAFEIEDDNDRLRILIEEDPEVNSPTADGGQKMWLVINKQTDVFIKDKNSVNPVKDFEVKLGQIAGGWLNDGDAIGQSYPAYALARRFVLVKP